MKYLINQKIFSFSDSFNIYDIDGHEVYSVVGQVLSIGHKLSFRDMANNELFYIKQRVMKLKPTYEIYKDDNLCCTISKRLFTFFHCAFDINSNYGDMTVKGNVLDHDYTFKVNEKELANVSKKWLSIKDKYVVDISDNIDNAFILASVIVLDLCCHDN